MTWCGGMPGRGAIGGRFAVAWGVALPLNMLSEARRVCRSVTGKADYLNTRQSREPVAGGASTVLDLVQSWGPKSGGVKRYILDKMNYLSAVDDLQHHLVIPGARLRIRAGAGTRTTVHEVRSPPIPFSRGYRLLLDRAGMLAVIDRVRPDVIEVGNAYLPAWAAVEGGRRHRIPVVGFYHSDFPRALADKFPAPLDIAAGRLITPLTESYLKRLYDRMAAVVVSTRKFEGVLKRMGITHTLRIPLGTDTDAFRPVAGARRAVLERLGITDPTTMVLLFVGRLAGMKNLDVLLDSMSHLPSAEGPFHLVLIGDGELRPMIRSAGDARSDVTWLSFRKNRRELAVYYSAADLFVNPGVHETFGLVSLEAQACGTRVLGVRGGGMDETLEGETPLIMAEEATPEALAAAVLAVRRLGEGDAARSRRRRRIVARFSMETTFDRLGNLYRCLAGHGAESGRCRRG